MTLDRVVESEPLRQLLGANFDAHCYAKDWSEVKAFILGSLKP